MLKSLNEITNYTFQNLLRHIEIEFGWPVLEDSTTTTP